MSVISGSSSTSGKPKTRVHVTVRTTADGDPQIVHVRVSPPESSLSLAEGQTSQDTEARGDQKKEQQAIPHRWQLTPQDEKTQALFNFNETALPPKSEFYPADENISEKLKLLYGESKVSPCCQKCSPCCCSCCVIQ
ncbi:uncharacterized protein LOC118416562 isoform X4 [Branchiostoma floridae]|uniref:Uncharacterized protein LOC118416562 isoform X4 n=1 Tax=Branchiostoma floridae TaxID=7739 RepID=A0A9J7MS03_BRAFL|nr:uncharacterized protein LOC118416562 isoform X4 [Branchiostoma floridae]